MAIFCHFLAKKILNFEFSHGYHYSHTLVDTWEKTLGSFQPKLMTKIEVISQKPSKTGFLAIFLHFLAKKTPNFEFSHGYHYSHTLADTQKKTLGSFQPKLMTKIEVISQKPSKNWIFGKNGHFLTVFGQKWPIFEFFSKIRLKHFFTFPKPYLTAKFQKKVMNGCLDICVTHVHLYLDTN